MVAFEFFEPFFSFVWYIGHNTTQGEGHSLPCLSLGAYGNLGGRGYGTLDILLIDYQMPLSFAYKQHKPIPSPWQNHLHWSPQNWKGQPWLNPCWFAR